MKITVRGYLTYQTSLGSQDLELVPGSTLQDLLNRMQNNEAIDDEQADRKPAGIPAENLIILLNGIHIRHLPAGENTVMQDGDQVSIFPPLAGG